MISKVLRHEEHDSTKVQKNHYFYKFLLGLQEVFIEMYAYVESFVQREFTVRRYFIVQSFFYTLHNLYSIEKRYLEYKDMDYLSLKYYQQYGTGGPPHVWVLLWIVVYITLFAIWTYGLFNIKILAIICICECETSQHISMEKFVARAFIVRKQPLIN